MLFRSLIDNRNVSLHWETASEENTSLYIVQRSKDLTVWNDLTEISAAGNSQEALDYQVWDNDPFVGLSYYRLKMIDLSGDYSYSENRSVSFDNGNSLSVYPNPVSDELLIVEANTIEEYAISVLSSLGQRIIVQSYAMDENRKAFEFGHLTSGIYFVELRKDGEEPQRIKFVVK